MGRRCPCPRKWIMWLCCSHPISKIESQMSICGTTRSARAPAVEGYLRGYSKTYRSGLEHRREELHIPCWHIENSFNPLAHHPLADILLDLRFRIEMVYAAELAGSHLRDVGEGRPYQQCDGLGNAGVGYGYALWYFEAGGLMVPVFGDVNLVQRK